MAERGYDEKSIDCTKCMHFEKATHDWDPRKLVCSVNMNAIRGIGEDRKQYHCGDYHEVSRRYHDRRDYP